MATAEFANVFSLNLLRNFCDAVFMEIGFGKRFTTGFAWAKTVFGFRWPLIVLSTLINAIMHIVVLRTKQEMVGVYTGPIVALMKNNHAIWYRSVGKCPSLTMCEYCSIVKRGTTVPVIVYVASVEYTTNHVSAIIPYLAVRRVAP